MRTLIRALVTSAIVTSALLVGASSALAGSTTIPAWSERYDFDDSWCFDQGSWTDCTVVDASMVITYTPAVRSTARIHYRALTTSYDNTTGEVVGQVRQSSLDRTVYVDGFQQSTFEVEHTNASGPWGNCRTTYQLKIVEYELQFERYVGPACA